MITIYKDNDGYYYDDQLHQLGKAKEAYDYVVACCKSQGIAVSQQRYTCYEEENHGDDQITKDITELSISSTQEMLCKYVDETYEGWGGKHYSEIFDGSKDVVVKPKSEWKAPAPQAPAAQAVKAEAETVKVLLDCTKADLNTKYHLKDVGAQKTMWKISGGDGLPDAKLYLGEESLGTLKELSMRPDGMIRLRNHLEQVTGKKFECQCRSEIATTKQGTEHYRQLICLAEAKGFDQNTLNTMVGSSLISVWYSRELSSGQEVVNLFWKKVSDDLKFLVYQ